MPVRRAIIHEYFVYIMTNEWRNVLYIGVTNSLVRRVWQHKNKTFRGFTKRYNVDLLVYSETYAQVEQAIAREKQLKGWTRARKNTLIESANPKWKDLAADWYSDAPRTSTGDPSLRSG